MRQWSDRDSVWQVLGLLAVLMGGAVAGRADAGENTPGPVIVGTEGEIFGTREAADWASAARARDPRYCPRGQADRDQAAQLYERAIAAQPGARINAKLADRIAQMYAFYEDAGKGVKPDRNKANEWWRRCIECTDSHQFIWAQAQMGLASMAVINHDPEAALTAYRRIAEVDLGQLALPDWQAWPARGSEPNRALLEQERARLREAVAELQGQAVEKLFAVFCQTNRMQALGVLQSLAARHYGTPVGERAAALLARMQKATGVPPFDLPDLTPVSAGAPPPAQRPPHTQERQTAASAPAGALPLAAEASDGGRRSWSVALGASVLVLAVGGGIVGYRRRQQLPGARRITSE